MQSRARFYCCFDCDRFVFTLCIQRNSGGLLSVIMKDKGSKHKNHAGRGKRFIKFFSTRMNRNATKEKLSSENYDDIPAKDLTKKEDPWSWD